MYNTLFYIFFGIITAAMLALAFSRSIINSVFSLFILLISLGGILTLLNSELISFVWILMTVLVFILLIFIYMKFEKLNMRESAGALPNQYYFTLVISLASALISSIVSSTRWQWFEINFELNSFALIFTKYLPAALMLLIITSVILSTFGYLVRKDESAQ